MTSLDEDLLTFQPSYHQQVLEFTSFVGLLHKDNCRVLNQGKDLQITSPEECISHRPEHVSIRQINFLTHCDESCPVYKPFDSQYTWVQIYGSFVILFKDWNCVFENVQCEVKFMQPIYLEFKWKSVSSGLPLMPSRRQYKLY